MGGRSVGDYMSREVVTLREDEPLRAAMEAIVLRRKRHVPVVDANGKLAGIVTDRDLKRLLPSPVAPVAAAEYEAIIDRTPVGRAMTREPLTVESGTDVAVAVRLMLERRIGGLPVLDGDNLVGVFTQSDALKGFLDVLEQ